MVSLNVVDLFAKKLFVGHPIKTFNDHKYVGIWETNE